MTPRLLGTHPGAAALQAAVLFALAGVLALPSVATKPDRAPELLAIAGADLVVAALIIALPWPRWPRTATVVLAVPAFAVLGFSTWALGGEVGGTGPFLVLIYAWAGLHFSRAILLALVAPALAAYLLPLIVTHQPPEVLGTATVMLPVAVGVAMVIEAQTRHLREDRARIEQIERWRAALVATLAHDVRSPLTTFHMILEELQEDDGRQADELITLAQRQVALMSRLATGLLDLDRIDAHGRLRLDEQQLPVREVVHQAVAHLRTADVDLQIDPTLVLTADRDRFEQIVVNLVANALRHGAPPVTVRVTTDGQRGRLEVRDHGPGVPPQARPRLFTRFAADSAPHGVGLGLWIVGQLARAHNGEAHYEDADPGARMVVTWPAHPRRGTASAVDY